MLVEIWSDVVCPWCAIGKARFDRALELIDDGDQIAVRYRSFELDPSAPRTIAGDYVDRLAAKYRVARTDAQAMIDRTTGQAADEGLTFDFSIARPGNTFDAHRLLHLAADRGVQVAVKERFLAGYLSEGVAIGTADALLSLAVDAGLDRADVADVLDTDAYADAVRADEQQARAYGITGVPFFVIDRRLGVSGAQPTDVLVQALDQARNTASPPATGRGGSHHRRASAHTTDHDHAAHDPAACADGSCLVH